MKYTLRPFNNNTDYLDKNEVLIKRVHNNSLQFNIQDDTGNPVFGAKLFHSGNAYYDAEATIPFQNPIICDSEGRSPNIFLQPVIIETEDFIKEIRAVLDKYKQTPANTKGG